MSPHQGLEPTVHPEDGHARARALALQRYTSALNRAMTPAEVAAVAVNEGRMLAAADGAAVGLVLGDRLRLTSWAGRDMRIQDEYRDLPIDADTPMTAAVATGVAVFSGSTRELLESYRMLGAHGLDPAYGSRAFVPLAVEDRPLGVLLLAYGQEGLLSGERAQLFIRSVSDLAAQALHRAMLFARERQARRDAVAAAERTARLQQVTARLADTTSGDDVLRILAQELVGAIAGARAFIYLLDPQGASLSSPEAQGVERPDPRFRTIPMSVSSPVTDAFRARRPLWFLSYEEYRATYPDLPPTEVDRPGGFGCLPLTAFGHDLGVLVVHVEAERPPEPADRSLAESIAAQGGLALERGRLYEAERRARARSTFLQRLSAALATAATGDEIGHVVVGHGREALDADRVVMVVADDGASGDRVLTPAAVAGDETMGLLLHPASLGASSIERAAVDARTPVVAQSGDDTTAAPVLPPGIASSIAVPIVERGDVLGAVSFGFKVRHRFDPDTVSLLETVSRLSGQALERARRYESERDVTAALQRSLLPQRFAPIDGVSLAVRYLAAGGDGVEIGGDWFDLVERPDGTILFAVGDVVGRGLAAATTMGQLRSAFRTIAMMGLSPSRTLTMLDGFAATLGPGGAMSTVACVELDPREGRIWLSSAGHLPPVLLGLDGADLLDGGRAVPLGLEMDGVRRTDVEVPLEPGTTVLLYTDGLVERRGEPLEEGLDRLREIVGSGPRDPEPMCDRLLADLLPDGESADDVALLGFRLDPADLISMRHRFRARPQELGDTRERVRDVLARAGADAAAIEDVILAANEAAANAVEHGSRSADDEVEIEIRIDGALALVIVRDNGRWRESDPEPTRGRGLALMRAVMQTVRVDHGAAGTTVTMTRNLA